MNDSPRTIKSLDRACRLMEELRDRETATVSELADVLDLSPATIHTYLATLKKHDLVYQDGTAYSLGPALIPLGEHVRLQMVLYQLAKEEIEMLSHESGGTAHLSCEHRGKLLILYETFGEDAIGKDILTRRRGKLQNHIHCTAAGKAMLAFSSPDRVDEILDHPLPAVAPNTITDKTELLDELEEIREQGFAYNEEEHARGIRGIGVPILYDDRVIGAISLSGPAKEWQGDTFREELPRLVIHAANVVEVNLHAKEDVDSKLMI